MTARERYQTSAAQRSREQAWACQARVNEHRTRRLDTRWLPMQSLDKDGCRITMSNEEEKG